MTVSHAGYQAIASGLAQNGLAFIDGKPCPKSNVSKRDIVEFLLENGRHSGVPIALGE